jgi:hypothetical protein
LKKLEISEMIIIIATLQQAGNEKNLPP